MNSAPNNLLVEVVKEIPSIVLDIRYFTTNNFTKQRLYASGRCFLLRPVVEKLKKVQTELAAKDLGLKIWDGYRPLHIQYKLWEIEPDERFVANPKTGSNHNRGAAVDITIVEAHGQELDMPTDFDEFNEKASANYNDLTKTQIQNRELLKSVMARHGLIQNPFEWWHFDDAQANSFPILDIDIEALQ